MKCFACALAVAAVVNACQHEIADVSRFHGLQDRLVKRQEATAFPPALGDDEAVLMNRYSPLLLPTMLPFVEIRRR